MTDRFERSWCNLVAWIDSPERGDGDELITVREMRAAVTRAVRDSN